MDNSIDEKKAIAERKEKLKSFFKEKYNWIVYVALAFVVFLATYVRTRNLPGLRDVTTGGWTLAQDLDPFLFLRWAKEIVATGTLAATDTMRYVPLGFNTPGELLLPSYLIAWFHNFAVHFGSTSVEQSAAILPVFMFALTVIAFFFLVRKIFISSLGNGKSEIIALLSSFFLSIIPSLLPRTIAGIPEKEASGFLFLFLSFYLFLCAWKSDKLGKQIAFAILAGISTAIMALIWGGFIYIYLVIALSSLIALVFRQATKEKTTIYGIWLLSSFFIMNLFSTRYDLYTLLSSTSTLIPVAIFGLLVVHLILTETRLKKYLQSGFLKDIPEPIITLAVTAILGLVFTLLFFGPSYLSDKFSDVTKPLIVPITDRLGVTVAENRQPYFSEWADSFGPIMGSIPIFFWIFFIGSIYLFSFMMRVLDKKSRILATIGYAVFSFALVFSRYSSTSIFNGTNAQSLAFYIFGFLALAFSLARPAISLTKSNKLYNQISIAILILGVLVAISPSLLSSLIYQIIVGICILIFICLSAYGISKQESLKEVDFGLILLFALFFLSIISARGSVRTIMVLVPAASITASYLLVELFNDSKKTNENYKIFAWIITAIIALGLLISAYQFYQQSIYISENNVKTTLPGHQLSLDVVYSQQWQYAMAWVRENTPTNAVFAHWWDYGYWVQTMGERATVLDGGNVIPYWDYLMGRHALTGQTNQEALDFLYSHKVTHFLIDSSDIGKYSAFSSIGSDENYDRFSSFGTFQLATQEITEKKNSTQYIYYPGQKGAIMPLDSDVKYNSNGTQIILPEGKAGIIAIVIEKDSSGIILAQGLFYYQGNQYLIPLRYAHDSNLTDFGSGINAGIFIFPMATQNSILPEGALLYLSTKTIDTRLVRLYLFNEQNPYFRLVHSEDNVIVKNLKQNGLQSDFVYLSGIQGPIKIWSVNYPAGMKVNPDYLQTSYLNPKLKIAK